MVYIGFNRLPRNIRFLYAKLNHVINIINYKETFILLFYNESENVLEHVQ